MNCQYCGAALNGTETVCPNCANPIQILTQPQPPVQPQQVVSEVQPQQVVSEVQPQAPVQPQQVVSEVQPQAPVQPQPVVGEVQPQIPVQQQPVVSEVQPQAPVQPQQVVGEAQPQIPVQPQQVVSEVQPQAPVQPQPVVVDPAAVAQVVQQTTIDPATIAQTVQPTSPAPTPVMMQPQQEVGIMPQQQTIESNVEKQSKKLPTRTKILLIIMVAVIILAIVLWATVLRDDEEDIQPAPVDETEELITQTTTNYSGYTFTIPDGYTSEVNNVYGLIIKNSDIAYTVGLDFTNKYDAYKENNEDKIIQVSGREYIALETNEAIQYITSYDDKTAFIGIIVKADYSKIEESNFNILNEILSDTYIDSSSDSSVNIDFGKDGIKKFNFQKSDINFNE